MRAASNTSPRRFRQRILLLGVVAAFAFAPLLANVWPAFGKGEMLYVGEVAAADVDHSAHEGHHAAADDSHHSQSRHQVHCALCVLALLGWAPPIDLSLGCTETRVIDRAVHFTAATPRVLLVWPDAQARAPPLS